MDSDVAIAAKGLGKRFLIGALEKRPTLLGRVRHTLTGELPTKELWALRRLDFEVSRGEIFGVIGRNGAGKSTLLQLLCRILAPSEGELRVNGKTDPFFQLSAGLRPALTVLDNIYLCAALLGMPRRELRRRLPEILDFCGLEEFLGARFGELSTGMAARLSLSVAVHGELDILLIDELLDVGDIQFQAKCKETFRRLAGQGKTLVIVSHGLGGIRSLCQRALYLKNGEVGCYGPAKEAADAFAADVAASFPQ